MKKNRIKFKYFVGLYLITSVLFESTALAQIIPPSEVVLTYIKLKQSAKNSVINSDNQKNAAIKEFVFDTTSFPKSKHSLTQYFDQFFKKLSLKTSYYKLPNISNTQKYHVNLKSKVMSWNEFKSTTNSNINIKSQCTSICPENLEILNIVGDQKKALGKNWLHFINSKDEYRGIKNIPDPTFNYCIGHSTIKMALRHLTFFDPDNKFRSTNLTPHSLDLKKELHKRLKKIVQFNEPQIIPYVSNIYELSEMLDVEMKQLTAWSWYSYGVSLSNLMGSINNEQTFDKNKILSIIVDLKKRILAGVTPVIIFNGVGDKIGHSAQVHEVNTTYNNKLATFTLVLDDSNNQPAPDSDYFSEQNNIIIEEIKPNQFSLFEVQQKRKLGRLEILNTSDEFYSRIIPKLANFCRKMTNCQ